MTARTHAALSSAGCALLVTAAWCCSPRDEARDPPAPPGPGAEAMTTGEDGAVDARASTAPPAPGRRERLAGYRARGEILELRSRRFPGAVVAVTLPAGYDAQAAPDRTWPLVIAFGGAGECARAPRPGALAWMRYYKADEAFAALGRGRLEAADFRGLVTPTQLAGFNERLRRAGTPGVILACPSSPPISPDLPLDSPVYEAFLMDEVIPALLGSYRVDRARLGIDGVSMGGARSMYYGLAHPETFASIGAVQGAFARHMDVYRPLLQKNGDALRSRAIQLVTSDGDVLEPAVMAMHHALDQAGVGHDLLVLTGPHDYVFNQGPGVLSLLLFHGEALRPRPHDTASTDARKIVDGGG